MQVVQPDGKHFVKANGTGSITIKPPGTGFRPVGLRLQSAHHVRLIGHPIKPGPRGLPDGTPCSLCALKAFTPLLDESRTESCQRHTLHHRRMLQEFDIRPGVSGMPLDSCHNYTSLNGCATHLVRQLDLGGWM